MVLDGKAISKRIREEIKSQSSVVTQNLGRKPGLAVLLVGDDPASNVYVSNKEKNALEVGFHSLILRKPSSISENDILEIVDQWNNDADIDGILVQLPLPKHIDDQKVINAIDPDKDVDGFSPVNMGRLVLGLSGFRPCTPAGIVELLHRYDIKTSGKHVVVVGRSNIVGKPIANMLLQRDKPGNSTVTVCHTGTLDLKQHTLQADILIAAMGVPEAIKSDMVKEGCVIIDVGMNRVEDSSRKKGYRLTGDTDLDNIKDKVLAYTPVPGGVGPMTIAMLLKNTLLSAENKLN